MNGAERVPRVRGLALTGGADERAGQSAGPALVGGASVLLVLGTDLVDGVERRRPKRAPSIVCDDVELYVCDDAEIALECVYVAGDPINLRDPWGLSINETTVRAQKGDPDGPNTTTVRAQRCDEDCQRRKREREENQRRLGEERADRMHAELERGLEGQAQRNLAAAAISGSLLGTRAHTASMSASPASHVITASEVELPTGNRTPAWEAPGARSIPSRFPPKTKLPPILNPKVGTAVVERPPSIPRIPGFLGWAFVLMLADAAGGLDYEPYSAADANKHVRDRIFPGGMPLGTPGTSPNIREVPGDEDSALDFFIDLVDVPGATDITPPGHPGLLYDVPGVGVFGYRPTSKSGPTTIDVDIPGLKIRKIKYK